MLRFRRAAVLVIALSPLLTCGCAAPATVVMGAGLNALGLGASTWIKGRLEVAELASLDDAHAAVRQTLDDLKFEDVAEHRAANGRWTEFEADDRQGRTLTVRCSAISPSVTKLSIRVGFWGDQAVSLALREQVHARLAGIAAADRAGFIRPEAPARSVP